MLITHGCFVELQGFFQGNVSVVVVDCLKVEVRVRYELTNFYFLS